MSTFPGLPPPDTVKPERITDTGVVKPVAPVPHPAAKLESKAGWREVGGIDEDEEELHQDWLSATLNDKYFGSWWHNAGIIFFCCFICWVLGRFGAGFMWIVFILAISSTYYRTSVKRVRNRVRDDLNREQAKQRLETDFESTEWLNTFLLKFWVIYEPVLSATIVASVDQVLSSQTPAFLDSLRLSKFTLGTKPPRVDQVKTYPKSEEDIVLMDWRFSFIPNDVSDLTARQLKNKVNPKIVLAIRVGKGLVGKDLPVLVEDMSFSGLMRIKIKLMAQFPHVKTVDLSFLERPVFDYVLKPIGGETLGFDIGNVYLHIMSLIVDSRTIKLHPGTSPFQSWTYDVCTKSIHIEHRTNALRRRPRYILFISI
jgi:Ca2+-dependent lipid-binding protein